MFGVCLERVRQTAPLIHCITNYVTVNDVANVLLACGASPVMADEPMEVEEISTLAKGLTLNLGTLSQRTVPAMLSAGQTAARLQHPIVLDPVGVGASRFRSQSAQTLLEQLPIAAIRCNFSELRVLMGQHAGTRGVDADNCDQNAENHLTSRVSFAKAAAKHFRCIVAVTGSIDLITDGRHCFLIQNGRSEMRQVTGTGCQLSALTAAFLAANQDHPLEAAAAAVACMGLAGEIGWSHLSPHQGNATYRNQIIDAIYHMDAQQLEEGAKYELQ
ncbi:MAG: hydroxyethylthiazole kinase [Lawsonibacter sp.]